jgi:hypothetical protein
MPLQKPVQPSVATEKKPPTQPWNRKGASPNPWEPDYLRLRNKHQGFRCRWVPMANVEQKQLQGWEICKPEDYGSKTDKHANDTSGLGSRIQRRELVLMEIPEDMAKQREAFLEHKAVQARRAAKAPVKEAEAEANRELDQTGHEHITTSDDSSEKS